MLGAAFLLQLFVKAFNSVATTQQQVVSLVCASHALVHRNGALILHVGDG